MPLHLKDTILGRAQNNKFCNFNDQIRMSYCNGVRNYEWVQNTKRNPTYPYIGSSDMNSV